MADASSVSTGGASSSLTIEEMGVTKPRKLVVYGSGLMHKGAEWSGTTAITTTWYNGNATATQQVMGPREDPSTWEGMWRRTMLSRTPARWTDTDGKEQQVIQPSVLRDIMDTLRFGGALLRVTWASDGTVDTVRDKMVREGRMAQSTYKIDTVFDIGWTIKFEWSGRGKSKVVPVSTRDDSVAAAGSAFEVAQNQLDTAAQATFLTSRLDVQNSANVFTLGQLESMSQAPMVSLQALQVSMRQTTTLFNQFLGVVNTLTRTPYDTAQAVTSLARSAQQLAQSYRSVQGCIPVELQTNRDTAASILRAHAYYTRVDDAVIQTSRAAAQLALRFTLDKARSGQRRQNTTVTSAARPDNILTVHNVRQDDTVMRLSMQYYSSPDYAWLICRANGLPWNQVYLPIGSLLTIPTLNSTSLRT